MLAVPADYRSIQAAIDAASMGDTVIVSPGRYEETINFGGKLITVRSSAGPLTTVITSDEDRTLVTFDHNEGPDAVLEGFTLRGGWIGVYCENAGPTIRGNILVGQKVRDWAAISIAGPGYPPSASVGPAPARIYNNTIVRCANGGVATFSSSAPIIRNNIIAFNAKYGIVRQGSIEVAQPDLAYNNVFGNSVNYINVNDTGIGTLSADPRFESDYSLIEGSPCIDAGDPDEHANDLDGTRNDMGAVARPPIVNLVQWPVTMGGNGHWYAIVPRNMTWPEAGELARALTQGGRRGYLATVESDAENAFILSRVLDYAWRERGSTQFWLGGSCEDGQWRWHDREMSDYANWALGEPNNRGVQTFLGMWGPGNIDPTRVPGFWNDLAASDSAEEAPALPAVIEWTPARQEP